MRFGKFTDGSYLWPFKGYTGPGDTKAGQGIAATRNLFPLPSTDLVANPTLVQNPGY